MKAEDVFTENELKQTQSDRKVVLMMVGTAWMLRLLVAAFLYRDLLDPARDYWHFAWEVGQVARSIALHQGFGSPLHGWTGPTAMLPPIYPYLLAIVFRICGLCSGLSAFTILAINGLFSALTCIPIFYTTKRALGFGMAKSAGWMWVFYPFAIYFSAGRVWDYALTALLLALCFWATQSLHQKKLRLWVGYGALWGVTALVNPSVLATFPFLLAIATFRARREHMKWRKSCLCAVLAMIFVITPWMARNYSKMHVFAPIRDNFWMEFWVGNTGDTSDLVPNWAHPSSSAVEMEKFQTEGEIAYISHKKASSLDFLRKHPGLFLQLCIRRMGYYWTGIWSFQSSYLNSEPTALPNILLCIVLSVLMLRGIFQWWRSDQDSAIYYVVMIVFFPFVYYVTHPLMDYRHPIEPQIVILVTVGWHSFKSSWNARQVKLARSSE